MNRINEKVKDLIEVCSYDSVLDFRADATETLKGYHFTDITSQLMSTWISALVDLEGQGTKAKALAGYRGVGKSHFLNVFAAIVGSPELRSGIIDTHVAAATQHLMRRRYPVAFVRRGTEQTLEEELRAAIAVALDCAADILPENLDELMKYADEHHSDVPFVIIIDTALGREKRVARDDGVLLGEMAASVKDRNIFIGVALDDDITEADGVNSAIANTFTIDYLDQEHLYRIVDSHIFRKHRQTESLIKDIYLQFRSALPSFKWSEQRFTSLYPLHPSILESAPFVRLYAPDFALLGFASEAGARIMGRPANSLIGLDEVFDKVEDTLRKAPDLKESFETYDAIIKEVISLIPVMQRLQAKLILKALFILSLEGDGTTAGEIAAAMLIYDENGASNSEASVKDLLETFVSIFPAELHRKEEGGDIRFSFKVSGKDDLNSALSEKVQNVPDAVIPIILSKVAKDLFADWNLILAENDTEPAWTDSQIVWRGGQRKARIIWNWGISPGAERPTGEGLDLEVVICKPGDETPPVGLSGSSYCWKPAQLTPEELDSIRRYHLLLNDDEIKQEYHEQVRAAGHTHSTNISEIWERIFLKDGVISTGDADLRFPEGAAVPSTVGEILAAGLTPSFEELFPDHPEFDGTLELGHVSVLVNDLFSGARTTNSEVQTLARSFAEPLGLASLQGENYLLAKEDTVYQLPSVSVILALVNESAGSTVSLRDVFEKLRVAPFGIVKEAQQLILAALVAHRKIEFVTSKGDRINRRSLDLKIIWDDIAGITKPADTLYSAERLNKWAINVTRIAELKSIDNAEDRTRINEGMAVWLADWEEANIVQRFAALPDEILNTKIWQVSVNVERAFGNVAESIRALGDGSISLEEALERIAESFSDSDNEYASRERELVALVSFIKSASLRGSIWGYLAICEITGNADVEEMRTRLLELIDSGYDSPDATSNKDTAELWKEFLQAYSDHFAIKHDSIMKSHRLQEKFDEVTKSDEWWEFERLSSLPILQRVHWNEAQSILRQLRELDCSFDVRQHLKNHPFCACSFNLSKMEEWEDLPDRLARVVDRGRSSYRKTLRVIKPDLLKRLEQFVKDDRDRVYVEAAADLIKKFEQDLEIELLTTDQLSIIKKVLSDGHPMSMVSTDLPDKSGIQSATALRAGLSEWLDGLPADPVVIRIN